MTTMDDGPEVVWVNKDGSTSSGRGKVTNFAAPAKKDWPDELIEEARQYVDRWVIEDGGDLREDQNRKVYWLDLDHLVEFEKADASITSDAEFWAWFKAYREKHNISPRKSRVTWNDWGETKRDYLSSSWWSSSWGWKDKGGADERRLAIALGVIQSIVSVLNDSGQRMRVSLAASDDRGNPMSYTNLEEAAVVVSPQALLDTSISEDRGIRVTAGYGLHEGSHVRHTFKIKDAILKPTPLKPMVVAGLLFNLLEDLRIERLTSQQFPGFAEYFDECNAYLWDVTKARAPKTWGPELKDKMNAIILATKWPTQYEPIATTSGSAALAAEFAWFRDWGERYRQGQSEARDAVIEALMHLNEDPQTKQQLDQQTKDEAAIGGDPTPLNDKQFGEFLKKLSEAMEGGQDVLDPCPSPSRGTTGTPVTLTPEQAAQVEQLLREELEQYQPEISKQFPDQRGHKPEVIITKPELDTRARSRYLRPDALVQRLKAAFVFRKTTPDHFERIQRSGALDEDEVYRIVGHDFRVFQRRITHETPNTQVTLLIDVSGSMGSGQGSKRWTAMRLATMMMECLRTMPGVSLRVRAHTDVMGNCANVYRIWEPGDPVERLGLIDTVDGGGNYDAFALDWCSHELVKNQRPGEDMILIIISDGLPNGWGLAGKSGMDEVRLVTDLWERKGVTTIQLAVDPSVRPHEQSVMYRHWLPYEGDAKLPGQFTKLLIKLFGGVSQ